MTTTNETVYVIRDAAGEWYADGGKWSTASNEALEYANRMDAENARIECGRSTAKVLSRQIEG